jgi:hypothetical protein
MLGVVRTTWLVHSWLETKAHLEPCNLNQEHL